MPDRQQVTTRELDLIIKELERLANCYEKLADKTMDKAMVKWLVGGAYALGIGTILLIIKLHVGG